MSQASVVAEKILRLDWIPMGSPRLRPPAHLKDFQRGWWINLFYAMFDAGGYLLFTSDLWLLSGALTRSRWESHCDAVLATFENSVVEGKRVIFLPAMIEVMEEQRKKLLRTRGGFSKPTTGERARARSLSQSEFDFESRARNESDRAAEGVVIDESRTSSPLTGKRAQRVERDRDVLRESLRRYGGKDA
jgi:hypothetical protein